MFENCCGSWLPISTTTSQSVCSVKKFLKAFIHSINIHRALTVQGIIPGSGEYSSE